ncbi:hypothetical protein [Merismopedia glauca]|uniref:Uncharacterized protein n=1 Tax=Merismopedia glauca CCAP 1448/3 TaxID=1296344 RepID=A0A2T1C8L6_9CYAN|nr:hypothetical protein [Merismopedia glauca]PSB04483.1 hypothetical protein C7B64_03425 [Merismopedia glauca CCAP 1448/3]
MANIVDNLLGGILGSKKNGSGKKGKYFLELKESEDPKPNQAVAKVEAAVSQVGENVSKAVDSVKPKVEAAASQVGENVSKAVDSVKPKVEAAVSQVEATVSQVVETVKPEAANEKKSKRTSVKDKATKKQQATSQPAPAVDPAPAAATAKVAKSAQSDLKTFSPYLNVNFVSSSRRRPGPSLDAFKSMAKEVGPRR